MLEAEVLCHAERNLRTRCGRKHALAFAGIHCHGLLAEHWLAMLECDENVGEMQSIG